MNQTALIRLTSWLSPVFPTGGFAYSGGLEQAVAHGPVSSPDHLRTWLEAQLRHGAPWNDAVILAQAWHGERDGRDPAALAELAGALAGSAQRHRETLDQGASYTAAK